MSMLKAPIALPTMVALAAGPAEARAAWRRPRRSRPDRLLTPAAGPIMHSLAAMVALHQDADRTGDETMPRTVQGMRTVELVSRRQAVATLAGGITLIAAPAVVRAQAPLKVTFVQQRGLLYLPVDLMVSGGILQKEAGKLGLGKIEATATGRLRHRGAAVAADAVGKNPRLGQRGQGGRNGVERRHDALHHQSERQDDRRLQGDRPHRRAHGAAVVQRHDAADGGG
jgi:hypothetical protein